MGVVDGVPAGLILWCDRCGYTAQPRTPLLSPSTKPASPNNGDDIKAPLISRQTHTKVSYIVHHETGRTERIAVIIGCGFGRQSKLAQQVRVVLLLKYAIANKNSIALTEPPIICKLHLFLTLFFDLRTYTYFAQASVPKELTMVILFSALAFQDRHDLLFEVFVTRTKTFDLILQFGVR